MPIRMTGMISGMDTESIIKQMVEAQKMKNKRTTDKRDLLQFEKDKWKDLNAKLLKLYTDDLGKMRMQGNYLTKKITSSNEDKVTVVASGTTAPEGSHVVEVSHLASSQYLTGMSLNGKTGADGKPITENSKLVGDLGMSNTSIISVETKTGIKTIEIDEKTTINGLVQQLRNTGVSANYDEKQGRFFVSSKQGGSENYFALTSSNDPSLINKRNIIDSIGYSSLTAEDKKSADKAITDLRSGDPTKIAEAETVLSDFASKKVKAGANKIATDRTFEEMKEAIKNGGTYGGNDYAEYYAKLESDVEAGMKKKYGDDVDLTHPEKQEEMQMIIDTNVANKAKLDLSKEKITQELKDIIQAKQDDIVANGTTVETKDKDGNIVTTVIKSETEVLNELSNNINDYVAGSATSTPNELDKLGLAEMVKTTNPDGTTDVGFADPATSGITLVKAQNSKITYNGVELTGDSNVFTVNGMTITAKGLTEGEKVSVNVTGNTQETYDMITGFVKSYNKLLSEMNTLYYAPSSKGYAPLSQDEKNAMSDEQIKKWEGKITDSILRRDDTMYSVMNAMKSITGMAVEVDGKKYTMSSFGVGTGTDYLEKGILHVKGDKEDSLYGAMDNKLMKALEEDPETVMKVFSGISQQLYDELGEKNKGITNVRSALTFYNDKQMDTVKGKYDKKIAQLEKDLVKIENKYYAQFAAMEKALAGMQSQTNALAGMLGN